MQVQWNHRGDRRCRPIGVTGSTGDAGSTGSTGATGSNAQISGVQAQLTNSANVLIDNNENIIFDLVLNNVNPNISYDNTTGIFILLQVGNYYVSWWVSIDGTGEIPLTLAIITSIPSSIISSTPPSTEQVTGMAFITVTTVLVTLALTNITQGFIQLANTSVQADIVILG